jgi:GLPGLI family protein
MNHLLSAIFLFLIFPALICSAQPNSSEVQYKVKSNLHVSDKKKEVVNDFITNLSEEMQDLIFYLIFNNSESIFSEKKNMSSSFKRNNATPSVSQAMSFTGKLYTNLHNGLQLHAKNISSDYFIIKSNINDINWKLTTEEKEINGYKCFKAIVTDSIITMKGSKKFEIIAWYAPALPYSFGPANYSGLPGLILELQTDKVTFYAEKISFNRIDSNLILIPTNGKVLTREEFHELERKGFEKYKRFLKN